MEPLRGEEAFQASPLGLQKPPSRSRGVRLGAVSSSKFPFYKDSSPIGLGPILTTSLYLHFLCKDPVSNKVTCEVLGVRVPRQEF